MLKHGVGGYPLGGRGTPSIFFPPLSYPFFGGYPPSLDLEASLKKICSKMNTFTWGHVKIENIRFHVPELFLNASRNAFHCPTLKKRPPVKSPVKTHFPVNFPLLCQTLINPVNFPLLFITLSRNTMKSIDNLSTNFHWVYKLY